MGTHHFLTYIVVGLLAGWIAGLITKGRGLGIFLNLVVGVVGAFIGGYVFGLLGIAFSGAWGLFVAAIVGAVILLVIVGLVRKLAN